MNVLLVDADSTIPNLALMKLSAYHKGLGDHVTLRRLNIPYYPNRKKTPHVIDRTGFNSVYCSIIFAGTKRYVHGEAIIYGGTGTSLDVKLHPSIENMEPDYSLYPGNDCSYGFISRGCIRKCPFCVVPRKEGNIMQVSTVDRIVRHKKVKFLDNNILALPNHPDILQELVDKRIQCEFTQGLDIRLLTQRNSTLLSQLRYTGEYTFAFDDLSLQDTIEKRLSLLNWRRDWQIKFFVYVHPDMPIRDTIARIDWLRNHKLLPYVMRDVACWQSDRKDFYTDLAAYCNQVWAFKSMSFQEFVGRRYLNNIDRIVNNSKLWSNNQ